MPGVSSGVVAKIWLEATLTQILVSYKVRDVHLPALAREAGTGETTQKQVNGVQLPGVLPTLAKVKCSLPFTTVWTPMGLTLPKPATSPLTTIVSCSYSVATTSNSWET